jgi:P22 coat protein - gene protein 5
LANSFLFVDWLTMESLRILVNKCVVAQFANTDYNKEYTREFAVGETVRVKLPQRYLIRNGLKYDPQALNRQFTTVTCDQIFGVDFDWDSVEKALKMERGEEAIRREYIEPTMAQIANEIDSRFALWSYLNTNNVVGQLGTNPTSVQIFQQARERLINLSCTPGEKGMLITPSINTSLVPALASFFNPSSDISRQYREGSIGKLSGSDWYESVNLYQHTAGTFTSGTVSGAGQSGSAITIVGNNGETLLAGDVISFDGTRMVNPMSRRVVGREDKQFVITQDITLTGGVDTININPAIVGPGQYQNVDVLPANGAAITLFPGTVAPAGKTGSNNLMINRDAFALVGVKLETPKAVEMASQQRDPETGIAIRFVRMFDPIQSKMVNRFDVLLGFGNLYPDNCSVRVLGDA